MTSIGKKAFGLVVAAAAYSHAIFGIGGQWAPAPALEIKSDSAQVVGSGASALSVVQQGVTGLQGFGLKVWIDALPFIDVEASTNMQFGYYDLFVVGAGERRAVEAELDVPFVEGKPVFARITSDVSVLYPFLKLPPVVSLVKLYAGGGLTHVLATEVVNGGFAKKAVEGKAAGEVDSPEELASVLADAIVDEGLSNGVGFHLMAGAKAKPPIIPLAVFANVKYHFLSTLPSAVDANAMTLEVGGALAF